MPLGLWLHHSPVCPLGPHLLGTAATGFKTHPKDEGPPSPQLNSICKNLLCRQGHILTLQLGMNCGETPSSPVRGNEHSQTETECQDLEKEGDGREGPEVQRRKGPLLMLDNMISVEPGPSKTLTSTEVNK